MSNKTNTKIVKTIHKGVAIYKTDRSPFWFARVWNPFTKKYVVRSTKETSRIEARDAALELFSSLSKSKFQNLNSKAPAAFATYADRLLREVQQRTKSNPRSYVYSDTKKILFRKNDGLVAYFGRMDVADITTGRIRAYLEYLDSIRSKPLNNSTKNKNLAVLKQVLQLALDEDVIQKLPRIKRLPETKSPRPSFTDGTYKAFIDAATDCATGNDVHVVRGHTIDFRDVMMFKFMVESYLRPTTTELFAIKRRDVQWLKNPDRLEVVVNGKTGPRTVIVNPDGKVWWASLVGPARILSDDASLDKYLVLSDYENRRTAVERAGLIFNHILDHAGLSTDPFGTKLTMYSFRHYALQRRLKTSNGQVNIYWLAQNAGTSVKQLEDFYLKSMPATQAMVNNLHAGIKK